MPLQELWQGIGQFLRNLTARVGEDKPAEEKSNQAHNNNQRSQRRQIPVSTGYRDPRDVGPRMLELFNELFIAKTAEKRSGQEIEMYRDELRRSQSRMDILTCIANGLKRENRGDYTGVIEGSLTGIASAEMTKTAAQDSLKQEKAARSKYEDAAIVSWLQICDISQEYFNQCWAVNFAAPWALGGSIECSNMQLTVKLQDLIADSRTNVRQLKHRLARLNSDRWKAKKSLETVVRGSRAEKLARDRIAEMSLDIFGVEAELVPAQEILGLREQELHTRQQDLLEIDVIPLLKSTGMMRQNAQQSLEPGSSLGSRGSGVFPNDTRSDSSLSEGQRSPRMSSSDGGDSTDLLDQYEQAQSELEELQAEFGVKSVEARETIGEASHMLTFPNSNQAQYASYIEGRLKDSREHLVRAEEIFGQAREALLRAGGTIPSTPTQTSQDESRRSLRSTDTAKVRNLNRRRLNRYRFSQRPVKPAPVSTKTRSSQANVRSVRWGSSRSVRTTDMPSSPGRKPRLREYIRKQESQRIREEQRRQGFSAR